MSVLDPLPSAATLVPAATRAPVSRPDARPPDLHGTLDEAVHRAVRRDLGRLAAVLSAPVTTVRRAAVVRHIEFLIPRLLAHHAGEDRRWNRVCVRRPDLANRAAAARSGHRAVRRAGQDVLSATRSWAAAGTGGTAVGGEDDTAIETGIDTAIAGARIALRDRVVELADLVERQFRQDERDRVLLADLLTSADWAGREVAGPESDRHRGTGRRPASVAHEVFWLVDELDPVLAARVVGRYSRPARWALRNLFSGGYNRAAHLMWVGGGDGPAL